ncbi:MAG: potassium channel family protein [Gemmatimonadaceae bacterium]
MTDKQQDSPVAVEERYHELHELEQWLEKPMIYLGFVWIVLLIIELTRGLAPLLTALSTTIWVIFIVDFVVRITLAPHKLNFLEHNWLTALSLVLPALRVLRFTRLFRVARFARGSSLVKVVGSLNRGMNSLGGALGRRGFEYVVALTLLVTFAGAAGMYAFERDSPGTGITSYWAAVWWTAMVMTTMGSDYFPHSVQGRALCLMLAVYAFAVFGYVTATLATFFVDRDASNEHSDIAGQKSVDALRRDIAALREDIRRMGEDQRAAVEA